MVEKTLINGEKITEISSLDRGLQYGDGVFETLAVENGELLCWHEHIKRLESGCKRLNIPVQDSDALKDEALSLIDPNKKCVIKLIITRGQGGRGYAMPDDSEPNRIVSVYSFPEFPKENVEKGITVRLCHYKYAHNERLAGIKHLNRLEQVLARSEWSDSNIAEGIVLDNKNNVIEGTMSNVFCVIGNVLCTPDLSLCGVEGITRNKILEIATTLGINTDIRNISLDDIKNSNEVFVCNSVIGIWAVTCFEKQKLNVGNITKQLRQALLDANCIPS